MAIKNCDCGGVYEKGDRVYDAPHRKMTGVVLRVHTKKCDAYSESPCGDVQWDDDGKNSGEGYSHRYLHDFRHVDCVLARELKAELEKADAASLGEHSCRRL